MKEHILKFLKLEKGKKFQDNRSLRGRRSKGKGKGITARGEGNYGARGRELGRETTREGGGRRGTPARKPLFSPSRLLIKKITKITHL